MKRRMRKLLNSIEKNGRTMTSKKLIATFCIEEGISKLTVHKYLEVYLEAEIVVHHGDKIMMLDQYAAMKSGDTERLKELSGGD